MAANEKQNQNEKTPSSKGTSISVVSDIRPDGTILETVYDKGSCTTRLCVYQNDHAKFQHSYSAEGVRYVPYAPTNNLIRHNVLLLPSKLEEYESEQALINEIRAFVHRYVDLTPDFEAIASYYVLMSWVYDCFNELPYLRFRGDYGSGKTRALLVIGSICFKPLFAGGASTVSPIFRMLDSIRGTLVIDEGDFRFSDEKAEIVKILNNGNARGFPVLRSEVSKNGEYTPHAFIVFGPKLVATRRQFQDRALESRCITEEMGNRPLRDDIPLTLPDTFHSETLTLRNKLLQFRLRNRLRITGSGQIDDVSLDPRLRQVFAPLVCLIQDKNLRACVLEIVRSYHNKAVVERGMSAEVRVLETILRLQKQEGRRLGIDEIRSSFIEQYGSDYRHSVSHRWIGTVVRNQLHLRTQKSNGTFVIPQSEESTIAFLARKHGLVDRSDSQRGDETSRAS
ncbi:MAG: hypothetical protein WD552_01415 [Candidatus Paceibacterota bacterium]